MNELIDRFLRGEIGSEAAYRQNQQAILDVLEVRHKFPLSPEDRAAIRNRRAGAPGDTTTRVTP
jgi:hypothetical protein